MHRLVWYTATVLLVPAALAATSSSADSAGSIYLPIVANWASGARIAFTRMPSEGRGHRIDAIYVMNADGPNLTNLTNNLTYDGDPAWSP